MKIFTKTSFAAVVLAATLSVGSANAFTLPSLPEISSNNVNVVIKDGLATIYGSVDNFSEKANAERYVRSLENVDRVINLVTSQ